MGVYPLAPGRSLVLVLLESQPQDQERMHMRQADSIPARDVAGYDGSEGGGSVIGVLSDIPHSRPSHSSSSSQIQCRPSNPVPVPVPVPARVSASASARAVALNARKSRRRRTRLGCRLDAGAALGHGWPFAVGPRSVAGVREPDAVRPNQEQGLLVTFAWSGD